MCDVILKDQRILSRICRILLVSGVMFKVKGLRQLRAKLRKYTNNTVYK